MGNFRDNIRKVTPYTPGEQPKEKNIIKLNTNECPYPPSKAVKAAIDELNYENFRLYPDPEAAELVSAIAQYEGVSKEEVFVGVGSDDVIAMAFQTFFNSDLPILFPDITYSFYDVWAELFKVPYKMIPVNDRFEIEPRDYDIPCGGVIFANPNAPTSIEMTLSGVRQILDANRDVIVIVDEAYIDFGKESAKDLLKDYDNLVVVRTFSKSRAMAGIRIGYAIASKKLIKALLDVKYSFNSYTMNMAQIKAGKASIEDKEYFEETVSKVVKTREDAISKLEEIGFKCLKSSANFIFATHESVYAKDIFEALKKKGIYVRYFNKDRIDNYLRITVGTDKQMERLCEELSEIVKG